MISPVDICNQALAHLGDRRIHRLDEDAQVTDATVRYCAEFYEQAKQEVLSSHRWTFAKKAVALTRSVGDTIFKYNYSHVLPTDMMRFLEILEAEVVEPAVEYVAPVAPVAPVAATGTLTITGDVSYPGESVQVGSTQMFFVDAIFIQVNNTINTTLLGRDLTQTEAAALVADVINGDVSSVANVSIDNAIPSTEVSAVAIAGVVTVTALTTGTGGNAIPTVEVLANGSWGASTLTGGVDEVVEVIGVDAVDATFAYSTTPIDQFEVSDSKILSDYDLVAIYYVADVVNTAAFQPQFIAALARLLASYISASIDGDVALGQSQRVIYEQVDLPRAMYLDQVQDQSNENSEVERNKRRSPLIRSRYRGNTGTSFR